MKQILSYLLALFACFVALAVLLALVSEMTLADSPGASPKGAIVLYNTTVPTNGVSASVSTNTALLTGYIDGIWLDQSGTAGQTSVVTVATTGTYGDLKASRTIYSKADYTTTDDGYCPIRQQAKTTAGVAISGVYVPLAVFGEQVYISVACHATSIGTNVSLRAVLVTSP